MRCALLYDESKALWDQEISAWGEMQSFEEKPSYREKDIKSEWKRGFFKGCKVMVEEVCTMVGNMYEDGEIGANAADNITESMQRELVMQLFSILDNQED